MRNLPALRLIALSALAGIVAGAIAVYVMGGGDGNTATAGGTQAACAAKAQRAAALEPAMTGDVAALLPADPPQSLRDLAFDGPSGERMTVADFAGRVLLVNLWATWCVPCREEMPALDALQREMGSERFEVVAVNIDRGDDAKPKAFLEEIGVRSLGYYRDNSLAIFNALKRRGLALGLPVTVLIDEEGCLLAHMNGPAEWAGADARRLVAAALESGD